MNIENKDFADLIKGLRQAHGPVYLDPPYVDTEKYYDSPFCAQDHQRLREVLGHIKAVSSSPTTTTRWCVNCMRDYRIEEVTRTSTLGREWKQSDAVCES